MFLNWFCCIVKNINNNVIIDYILNLYFKIIVLENFFFLKCFIR